MNLNVVGYEISNIISDASDGRINWQAGSLYPMLKKMEAQGLIKSDWIIENNSRARRYYTIIEKDLKEIDELREEWQLLSSILYKLKRKCRAKNSVKDSQIPKQTFLLCMNAMLSQLVITLHHNSIAFKSQTTYPSPLISQKVYAYHD